MQIKENLKTLKKNPWILWLWNENRRKKGKKEYNKISDEQYVKNLYYSYFDKDLNLENPKTFNEKINWMKLNYKNEKATICADKYEVRKY
ncbi:hypothetical protein P5F50_14850, partial [Clostridium perfringens]|nr:hypothetical protein [Clostridium perfringens]